LQKKVNIDDDEKTEGSNTLNLRKKTSNPVIIAKSETLKKEKEKISELSE